MKKKNMVKFDSKAQLNLFLKTALGDAKRSLIRVVDSESGNFIVKVPKKGDVKQGVLQQRVDKGKGCDVNNLVNFIELVLDGKI